MISDIDVSICIKQVKGIISSSNLYNKEMDWEINDLVNSLYSLKSSIYNWCIGLSNGFKYFIYLGGIIGDSRDFCVAHSFKVWSIEEAKQWPYWTPAQGVYPDGYVVKANDIHAVPSYLGYPGYYPLIDLGGIGCRHKLG